MVVLRSCTVGCFALAALRVSPAAAQAFVPSPQPPPVAAQPAPAPPRAVPLVRASPVPPKPSEERGTQRAAGLMIGASIGLGTESTLMLDGRLGALVHPNIAVFAEAMGVATFGGGAWILGGGVRLASEWVFLEARFGRLHRSSSCEFDEPCTSDSAPVGMVGAGLELVRGAHAGLELRIDALRAFHDTVVEVGLGGSFYVF